jgi:thiosulfate/3-mercaptopyruvate sulfurtransferase
MKIGRKFFVTNRQRLLITILLMGLFIFSGSILLSGCGAGGAGAATPLSIPADHLVTSAWVNANLSNSNLILVDTESPAVYETGHIPGSVDMPPPMQHYFTMVMPLTTNSYTPIMGEIPSPWTIETDYQAAGINNNSVIVFYGNNANNGYKSAGYSTVTRALWTAWVYGLTNVAILNGGLTEYKDDGYTVATGAAPAVTPGNFTVTSMNIDARATFMDIFSSLYLHTSLIIDSRPASYYTGTDTDARFLIHGHIPGAINVPFSSFELPASSDSNAYELATPAQANTIVANALAAAGSGVTVSELESGAIPAITQCNTGYWASEDWFVFKFIMGVNNTGDYNGSWVEYSNIPGAPVVDEHTTSPAP